MNQPNPFDAGMRVELYGLQSEKGQALNGALGTILGFNESSGRYMVRLGMSPEAGKEIKDENRFLLEDWDNDKKDVADGELDRQDYQWQLRWEEAVHSWARLTIFNEVITYDERLFMIDDL